MDTRPTMNLRESLKYLLDHVRVHMGDDRNGTADSLALIAIRWPEEEGEPYVLAAVDGEIYIDDFPGHYEAVALSVMSRCVLKVPDGTLLERDDIPEG